MDPEDCLAEMSVFSKGFRRSGNPIPPPPRPRPSLDEFYRRGNQDQRSGSGSTGIFRGFVDSIMGKQTKKQLPMSAYSRKPEGKKKTGRSRNRNLTSKDLEAKIEEFQRTKTIEEWEEYFRENFKDVVVIRAPRQEGGYYIDAGVDVRLLIARL